MIKKTKQHIPIIQTASLEFRKFSMQYNGDDTVVTPYDLERGFYLAVIRNVRKYARQRTGIVWIDFSCTGSVTVRILNFFGSDISMTNMILAVSDIPDIFIPSLINKFWRNKKNKKISVERSQEEINRDTDRMLSFHKLNYK